MLPQSYSTKPSRRTRRVPAPSLHHSITAGRWLEGSVLLNDGEEDLGWRIPHLGPTVMTLPLISNRPTSWTGRNRLARVGCGPPPVRERRPRGGPTDIPPAKRSPVAG